MEQSDGEIHEADGKIAWTPLRFGVIALLSALLLFLLVSLIDEVVSYRQSGILVPQHRARDIFGLVRTPTNNPTEQPPTIDEIRSWMTFDFLNKTFHLQPGYLKTSLDIQDAHYPNISIRRYASSMKLNTDAVLERIKADIRAYPAPKP